MIDKAKIEVDKAKEARRKAIEDEKASPELKQLVAEKNILD